MSEDANIIIQDSQVSNSKYFKGYLLQGVTRTWQLTVKSKAASNIPDDTAPFTGNDDQYNILFQYWTTAPNVGDVHPSMPNLYCNDLEVNPYSGDASCTFEAVATYEGPTAFSLWEDFGSLSQELSYVDHNNYPNIVLPPPGTTVANNAGVNPSINPAGLLRFFAQGMRRLTFYTTNSQTVSYIRTTYLGMTNENVWADDDPRTWLCTTAEDTSENMVVFKIVVTFLWRERTWDEVALWLNAQEKTTGKMSPTIPNPSDFPTSTLGFVDPSDMDLYGVPGGDIPLGWGRFVMENTANFDTDFGPPNGPPSTDNTTSIFPTAPGFR